MSRRSRHDKQIAKLRKLTRQPIPASFDLVDWLKDRRYAKTTGEANQIILAKRVRSESHVIGVLKVGDEEFVQRVLPVAMRKGLIVLDG